MKTSGTGVVLCGKILNYGFNLFTSYRAIHILYFFFFSVLVLCLSRNLSILSRLLKSLTRCCSFYLLIILWVSMWSILISTLIPDTGILCFLFFSPWSLSLDLFDRQPLKWFPVVSASWCSHTCVISITWVWAKPCESLLMNRIWKRW